MAQQSPFSESDLRAAIEHAGCWAEAARFLGYATKGSNYRTLQRNARRWNISTDHFDPHAGRRRAGRLRRVALESILVENSTYPRGHLKARLFAEELKHPICELCGQDESWNGRKMSLVLDHINGIFNDHRLENLRIVCPNCAATLATHCGRNLPLQRTCPGCGGTFAPKHVRHRYCSQHCWGQVAVKLFRTKPRPETRKVPRPSYDQLTTDLKSMSFLAMGRKYGVSDNAIRKWIRWYEYARDNEAREDQAA